MESLTGLAQAMLQHGLLPKQEAGAIEGPANSGGIRIVEQLVRGRRLRETRVAEFCAEAFERPLPDLSAVDLEQVPLAVVDDRLIRTHRALPLFQGRNPLFLGVSDATSRSLLNGPRPQAGVQIDPIVVEYNKPGTGIHKLQKAADKTRRDLTPSSTSMVGEIWEVKTGEIAVKAARTAHWVLSTLHGSDVPTTLAYLLNMCIALLNIVSSAILLTAQRLASRLYDECKRPVDIPLEALVHAGFIR